MLLLNILFILLFSIFLLIWSNFKIVGLSCVLTSVFKIFISFIFFILVFWNCKFSFLNFFYYTFNVIYLVLQFFRWDELVMIVFISFFTYLLVLLIISPLFSSNRFRKFLKSILKTDREFKPYFFIFITLFFQLISFLLYGLIIYLVTELFYHFLCVRLNLKIGISTFFYVFKYDFPWLIFYVWGIPVFICLVIECLIILFFLTEEKSEVSKAFQERVANWCYTNCERDLLHLHNFFHYPFKAMGNSFKFSGNYLNISKREMFLVYISSIVIIIFLTILWVHCLFFSIFINKFFWGFWENECVHFDKLFKFLSKNFILFSIFCLGLVNTHLAISIVFAIAFTICFAGNLFINYNVDSGEYYEPLYFYVIGGNKFCMVTGSQFRVYNNLWTYKGINWSFEEVKDFDTKYKNREIVKFSKKVE